MIYVNFVIGKTMDKMIHMQMKFGVVQMVIIPLQKQERILKNTS
ncbi:hypothetical protein QY97_03623 [Bacillus thermotolerans]|nr:hypothetical protein QY97_03623 [Bacillus thermotolerans]